MSRKRFFVVTGLVLALALLVATPAFASKVITKGGDTEINSDVDDDVYFMGENLTVNATIDGDLIAFANTVTINGTITGDAIIGASTVIVNGEIQDDARLAGYAIVIEDGVAIGDDLNAGCYSLEMKSQSSIGGDAFFGGFQALLRDVAGDLYGGGAAIRLAGTVGGNATLGVASPDEPSYSQFWQPDVPDAPPLPDVPMGLSLAEGGSVEGDLTYTSSAPSDVDEGDIGGRLTFELEETAAPEEEVEVSPGAAAGAALVAWVLTLVRRFVTLVAVGALLMFAFPDFFKGIVATLKERVWPSLGVGALGYTVLFQALFLILAILIAIGVLLSTVTLGGLSGAWFGVGGISYASLIMGFILVTSWVAKVIVGYILGAWLVSLVNKEADLPFWSMVIGVFIIAILRGIPVLGFLIGLGVALFGLGAVVLHLWPRRPVEAAPLPPTEPSAPTPAV